MAYVLRLEDLRQEVHAHTVAAGIAAALGAQQVAGDRADWALAKARFDAALAAPMESKAARGDGPRDIKLRALNLA